VVKLSSSDPSVAAVPASVTVAAGRSTVTFKVSHHEVSTETSVSIGATISGVTQTATLTVTP
jgi:polyisoprenoid-binding protein YceI